MMHQQFLRGVGVKAATLNATLKLNRIHYHRPTKREAAQVANANTVLSIDPITLLNAELTGTSVMPMRDVVDSSCSRTDTTRTCLRWHSENRTTICTIDYLLT